MVADPRGASFERAPPFMCRDAVTCRLKRRDRSSKFSTRDLAGEQFLSRLNIAYQRLCNQYIARPAIEKPSEVVSWFGAVQAQDYVGSLWAIGLRMSNAVEGAVEQAVADRTIIRTWPMRGTLHFVAVGDIRWMLELLAPRVLASAARRQHQLELDELTFIRSRKLFERALRGGKQLTRSAAYELLKRAHISPAGQRGIHILGRLALDGVLCFGAREGKQQTFALLDEWAPPAKTKPREEALAELARRYFSSHGPATLQDFAWWSGLRMGDARTALELAKTHLVTETVGEQSYWFSSTARTVKDSPERVHLLPPYDEYTVAYKDRSAVLDPRHARLASSGNGIFYPSIVLDGQVVGTWKRELNRGQLLLKPSPFARLNKSETRALASAASRYGDFLGLPVALSSGPVSG